MEILPAAGLRNHDRADEGPASCLRLATARLARVVAQEVSARTPRTGISLAFPSRGLRVGVGGLAGQTVSLYAQRWITGLHERGKPCDPRALAASAGLTLAPLRLAIWWPARRASRTDPQQALRYG